MSQGPRRHGPKFALALPSWVWYLAFFVVPLAFIVVYSFGYKPPINSSSGSIGLDRLSLDNYRNALSGDLFDVFTRTLRISLLGTALCMLIAFPLAYWLAVKVPSRWRVALGLVALVLRRSGDCSSDVAATVAAAERRLRPVEPRTSLGLHMPSTDAPRIALVPDRAPDWMSDAVTAGGGHLVAPAEAEGLVWSSPTDADGLAAALRAAPGVRWVQLPWAGVERFVHLMDDDRLWTCGKGVYAEPVAEMVITLALAGMRGLGAYARANAWSPPQGTNLLGARVTILGGGGITESLLRLLQPFDCHITVVRNRAQDMDGADVVLESDLLTDALPGADLVVVALSLTPDTEGIISASEFELMESHAWLVNVARGRHVVTDDLVVALRDGIIGGAALDVTDPEPLPEGHPLWSLPNCIITPHVANTPDMAKPLLAERITTNVRRFARGEELIGPVDPELGY